MNPSSLQPRQQYQISNGSKPATPAVYLRFDESSGSYIFMKECGNEFSLGQRGVKNRVKAKA